MHKIPKEEENWSKYQHMILKDLSKIGTIEDRKECKHLTIEKEPVKIVVQWGIIESNALKDQERQERGLPIKVLLLMIWSKISRWTGR